MSSGLGSPGLSGGRSTAGGLGGLWGKGLGRGVRDLSEEGQREQDGLALQETRPAAYRAAVSFKVDSGEQMLNPNTEERQGKKPNDD